MDPTQIISTAGAVVDAIKKARAVAEQARQDLLASSRT